MKALSTLRMTTCVVIVILGANHWRPGCYAGQSSPISLSEEQSQRCVRQLRAAAAGDEFWPSMHAAEALSLAGYGDEVRNLLEPLLATTEDEQHRCGVARELVRAGDRKYVAILLEILQQSDPYAHAHACESLYKVNQIGDGKRLRRAMSQQSDPRLALMAAAALGRWGNPHAMELVREQLANPDGEMARVAAWILGRIGAESDINLLRAHRDRFQEPLTRAYFDHALAALGDAEGVAQLARNLSSADPAIRTYAATFAGDARATDLKPQLLELLDDSHVDVRVRAAQSLLVMNLAEPESRSAEFATDVFSASAEYPRYSEASIISLRDGTLLLAATRFIGNASDFAAAEIVAVRSTDGGRNWSEPVVLQNNTGSTNVMSVTLRRLVEPAISRGPIGLFYLIKNSPHDLKVWLRVSSDEGESFGEPILVTDQSGYHVMNNDRVTVLNSGRLLVPVASTSDANRVNHYVATCFISDDHGVTWRAGRGQVDYAQRGAMEPEVLELGDGRVLMILRTQLGHIAYALSADGGDSWSEPAAWRVRAPEAPATLRRIPATGDLMLVWNDTYVPNAGHGGARTPLTVAISGDEGNSWQYQRNLEESATNTYAYTSLLFDCGQALLSYYVRDEATGRISLRVRSLPISHLFVRP
jgi:sialidase-1